MAQTGTMRVMVLVALAACGEPHRPVVPAPERTPPPDASMPAIVDAAPEAAAIACVAKDLARVKTNDACARATGYSGPIDHCRGELLGNGSTALLNVVTECGGDSCDVKSWVCSPATKGLIAPIDSGGGNVAASPGGDFLIVDDDHAPPEVLRLARIDVATGARAVFADCVSPKLSPGGKWIACRNHAGDVLRVPIGGGNLEVVARSGANVDQVPWVPHAYIWPEPVEFPAAGTVAFVTLQVDPVKNDVRKLQGRAAWHE